MAGKKKSGRARRNAKRSGNLSAIGGKLKKKQKRTEGLTHSNHGAKTHKGFMSLLMK
jgi:hypothetical protein